MTDLSVNLNKIALLRNSRGRDYPSVVGFAQRYCELGVKGITVHPRPDERHITQKDVVELRAFLQEQPLVELNVEGYPSAEFLKLMEQIKPDQCTLVPDSPEQLTSDHGWDFPKKCGFLADIAERLHDMGIRVSMFADPIPEHMSFLSDTGADRIELYTEAYAQAFGTEAEDAVLKQYSETAAFAQALGFGVNAGHDLDLQNLAKFLSIPNILEVSIGHALTVESLERGIPTVIDEYLSICCP